MKEIWKDINFIDENGIHHDYTGIYQVSNLGRVRTLPRVSTDSRNISRNLPSREIKPYKNNTGYYSVQLYKNLKRKIFKIHRLVAYMFIPNPDNKPTVDHIDCDKSNNCVSNLRWFTSKEQINNNLITRKKIDTNVKKAIDSTRKKCICTTTSKVFNSVKEASEFYKIKEPNISACCRGESRYSGKLPDGTKLKWEYLD